MKRLTKEIHGASHLNVQQYRNGENITHKQIINKLGQLEDIEEKIGIDLITYLKVNIQGYVYVKGKEPEWAGFGTKRNIQKYYVLKLTADELIVYYNDYYEEHCISCPMGCYGKTWALTRKELEQ